MVNRSASLEGAFAGPNLGMRPAALSVVHLAFRPLPSCGTHAMLLKPSNAGRARWAADRLIYEAIGPLMRHAGEALTTRHSGTAPKDVRSDREFRQVATLLNRIGSIWPHLFDSLARENRVFEQTLKQVRAECSANSAELPPPTVASTDPLVRYRECLLDLDRA